MNNHERLEASDSVVLYFGGEFKRINAYTLAETLVSISDAAQAANAEINPGYEIEIVVEALAEGSFKTQIKALYKGAKNLFSAELAREIVVSVVAGAILHYTLPAQTKVVINTNEVLIESEGRNIVVPREVHDGIQKAENNYNFKTSIETAVRAIDRDPDISSIGFSKSIYDKEPSVNIPKKDLKNIDNFALSLSPPEKEIEAIELVDLVIVRAILEESRRRWQFVWNDIRIAAPILDKKFYRKFEDHHIKIAPGDRIRAYIKIYKIFIPNVGIYQNYKYEIVEVVEHIPRPRQDRIAGLK